MNARNRFRVLAIATVSTGFLIAPTAVLPQAAPPGPAAFSDFDLNKDGKIVEGEFNEARAARIAKRVEQGYPMRGLANAASFADIDRNGDGAISPEEFAAHQATHSRRQGN